MRLILSGSLSLSLSLSNLSVVVCSTRHCPVESQKSLCSAKATSKVGVFQSDRSGCLTHRVLAVRSVRYIVDNSLYLKKKVLKSSENFCQSGSDCHLPLDALVSFTTLSVWRVYPFEDPPSKANARFAVICNVSQCALIDFC